MDSSDKLSGQPTKLRELVVAVDVVRYLAGDREETVKNLSVF